MQKLRIRIDKIYIYDPFRTGSYSLQVAPEYFRFFDEYGDTFQDSDGQYSDYGGTYYNYPGTWSGGYGGCKYDDLNIEFSYCAPLDYNEPSEYDDNEILVYFKVTKTTSQVRYLYFGDNEPHDSWFWTPNIYFGSWGGGFRVYMMIDYL